MNLPTLEVPDEANRQLSTTPDLLKQLRQLILEEDERIATGVADDEEEEDHKDEVERISTPPPEELMPTKWRQTLTPKVTKRWTMETLHAQKQAAHNELMRLTNNNEGRIIDERIQVLQEIFDSERTYVKFLELLFRMYYSPLIENAPDLYARDDNDTHGLPANVKTSMFPPNLATILNFNRAFLERLEERKQQYGDLLYFITIGDIYGEMAPFLKVYVSYVTQYERAVQQIRKNRKKYPQFDHWLERRKRHAESNGLDLNSLMVMPVQKLPRHRILLQALLDKTDKEHADYSLLQEAHDAVSVVADFQNAKIRDTKNSQRVYQISKKLKLKELVSPSRRIIREGNVLVRGMSSTCYLFNDLVVVERNAQQPEIFSLLEGFIGGGDEHSVDISVMAESGQLTTVSLLCESHEDKNKWHDAFFNTLCDLNERENDEIIRHVDDPKSVTQSRKSKNTPLLNRFIPADRLTPLDLSIQLTPRSSSANMERRRSLQFHRVLGTPILLPTIVTTPTSQSSVDLSSHVRSRKEDDE
jgi:hypothetical protein